MKKVSRLLPVIAIVITGITILSCNRSITASSDSSPKLEYRFSGDKEYTYLSNSKVVQSIEFGGQDITAQIDNNLGFKIRYNGSDNEYLNLNVTIDSIKARALSMGTEMTSSADQLEGTKFEMKLSRTGEESGLDEAEKITYKTVGDQETSLKWSDSDTLDMIVNDQSVRMIINSKNHVVAMENLNGFNCYKIEYTTTGERSSAGNTPQGYMSSNGSLEGTGTLYFAPAEGVVVMDRTTQKFKGDLVIPTGESLPMFMDIDITTSLLGK